jgi:hypothetical protein
MRAQAIWVGVMLVAAALPASAGNLAPNGSRMTITVMKPDFTRPGGQPGAVREVAPARPKAKRRGRPQTSQP